MEREAGEARECQALQEEQQTQPRQEKQDHMYAQPLFFLAVTHWALARALRARARPFRAGGISFHLCCCLLLLMLVLLDTKKCRAERRAECREEGRAEERSM